MFRVWRKGQTEFVVKNTQGEVVAGPFNNLRVAHHARLTLKAEANARWEEEPKTWAEAELEEQERRGIR